MNVTLEAAFTNTWGYTVGPGMFIYLFYVYYYLELLGQIVIELFGPNYLIIGSVMYIFA